MNKFAVGAFQARRLIQTESAAMSAFADQLAYEDAGIEKEMFIAVHDSRTSKICQQHDRSIVEISKAQVGVNVPPLRPNCRSHMIAYIEGITDAMKKRQRNPITGRDEVVDLKEDYNQWLKRQQEEHGVDTVDTFIKKTKNLLSDRKQYQRYMNVLGKENMPTSLSKFQDMKYNDIEKWKDLKSLYKATNNGMILQSRLDYSWNGENNFIPTGTALTSINIIAGKGSNTTLRVADSLAKEYGGQSKDWSKKVAKITSDKYVYDVHWYEYNKMQYKAKVKMRKDRKK